MFLPQYSPQGLMAPFISPALFGQPGAYPNGSLSYYGYGPSAAAVVPPFISPFAATPIGFGGAHPAQTIVPLLGQLAQQFSAHGIVSQQIATVLHHLVQQVFSFQLLAQSQPFIGAGQFFGLGTPMLGSPISQVTPGQYLTPSLFTGVPQAYGFTPQQAQAWGATRAQTIQ